MSPVQFFSIKQTCVWLKLCGVSGLIFWCRKFLSSPSYQEWFWRTRVNRKYSGYKSHEKYLYINFSVPNFKNIQTIAFALHSCVPCYGSRLPYWSTALRYLVMINMDLKMFTHFIKISFCLGTSRQCFWPGIKGKWTVCVFWVFCHNASHILSLVLICDMGMNLLSGSRNESRPCLILSIMSLYILHLLSLTLYIIKYVVYMC